MTDTLSRLRPEKTWRVYSGRVSTDYAYEKWAYRRVSQLTDYAVYHWYHGAWRLVERSSEATDSHRCDKAKGA